MTSPVDKQPNILDIIPAYPLPPLNFACSAGFDNHSANLWWSNPTEISANTKFNIIGVNIYRSFDSEFGPFFRLNSTPIQINYWKDDTRINVVLREDVSNSFLCVGPTDPSGRWIFKTKKSPIVIQPSLGTENINDNVFITVDSVSAKVRSIVALTGEVELDGRPIFNEINQKKYDAILPSQNSVVLASYRYIETGPRTSLYQRVFYRVTSVAVDELGSFVETPIKQASCTNTNEVEKIDWIWREAIRRNKFILQQGGERVKVFIRKCIGQRCGCFSNENRQSASDCLVCYGTSIIGGYDGPYDIVISPDDAERNIAQSNRGRSLTHSYDTWTGPQPLLSQRDFIVKLNGDRYGIGPVKMPSNRGMQLQQHFMISHIDEGDIRYKVPVLDISTMVTPETRYTERGGGLATPMITERSSVPDEREFRGKTVVYENTNRR